MGLIYLENTIFFSIWVASLNGLYSYTYSPYNYITLLNELRHIKFQYILIHVKLFFCVHVAMVLV